MKIKLILFLTLLVSCNKKDNVDLKKNDVSFPQVDLGYSKINGVVKDKNGNLFGDDNLIARLYKTDIKKEKSQEPSSYLTSITMNDH